MSRALCYLIIVGISMLPVVELRGAIPTAALLDVEPRIEFLEALPFAVIGNIIPVPFIMLFFGYFLEKFRKVKKIGPLLEKIHNKAVEKSKTIGKYQLWGLFTFVAIPLPGTGAWTGTLIATVLEMKRKSAFFAIFAGVITSGLIMGFISYGLLDIIVALFK